MQERSDAYMVCDFRGCGKRVRTYDAAQNRAYLPAWTTLVLASPVTVDATRPKTQLDFCETCALKMRKHLAKILESETI